MNYFSNSAEGKESLKANSQIQQDKNKHHHFQCVYYEITMENQ